MKYKIYQVLWEDAITSAEPGWTVLDEGIKDAETPPPVMNTVGFCLYEGDSYIALTDSLGSDECGQVTKIPKAMIKELNILKGERDEEIMGSFDI